MGVLGGGTAVMGNDVRNIEWRVLFWMNLNGIMTL